MRAGSSEELGGSYASGCYGAAMGSLLPACILNRAWVGHSDYGGYYHQPTYSRKKGAWATRPAVGGYGLSGKSLDAPTAAVLAADKLVGCALREGQLGRIPIQCGLRESQRDGAHEDSLRQRT